MYSAQQIAFTLAWIAFNGDLLPFGPLTDAVMLMGTLKQRLVTLSPLDDEWTLVWGPTLHQPLLAIFNDDAMFVLQNKADPRRHVIVIRGTNPASVSTWLFQNLVFAETVEWPFGAPTAPAPRISGGTSTGLTTLLGLSPVAGVPGQGLTLLRFLAQQTTALGAQTIDVTVTGHSLGGVLASTLAVALSDTQKSGDTPWNPGAPATLHSFSFGAPTAGDRGFAQYSDQHADIAFSRCWNTLDVVPHAWDVNLLRLVPGLYPQSLPDLFISGACTFAEVAAAPIGYRHPSLGAESFTGALSFPIPLFGAQALYQHSQPYLDYLGLADVLSVLDVAKSIATARTQAQTFVGEQKARLDAMGPL